MTNKGLDLLRTMINNLPEEKREKFLDTFCYNLAVAPLKTLWPDLKFKKYDETPDSKDLI